MYLAKPWLPKKLRTTIKMIKMCVMEGVGGQELSQQNGKQAIPKEETKCEKYIYERNKG